MERASSRPVERASVQRRRMQQGRIITIVGFLLPAAILYVGLVLFPVIQAVYFSFFRWNGLGPLQNFTGLANYTRAFGDRVFVGALGHNFLIVLLSLFI